MKCCICRKERPHCRPASILYEKKGWVGKFVCKNCAYEYTTKMLFSGSQFQKIAALLMEKAGEQFTKVCMSIAYEASKKTKIGLYLAHESQVRGWGFHSKFAEACLKIASKRYPPKYAGKLSKVLVYSGSRRYLWDGDYLYMHMKGFDGKVCYRKLTKTADGINWEPIQKPSHPASFFAADLMKNTEDTIAEHYNLENDMHSGIRIDIPHSASCGLLSALVIQGALEEVQALKGVPMTVEMCKTLVLAIHKSGFIARVTGNMGKLNLYSYNGCCFMGTVKSVPCFNTFFTADTMKIEGDIALFYRDGELICKKAVTTSGWIV